MSASGERSALHALEQFNHFRASVFVVEEVDRPKGVVPHQLPGTNTFVKEFADKIHVPEAVIRAGAETMYPEIRKKLK